MTTPSEMEKRLSNIANLLTKCDCPQPPGMHDRILNAVYRVMDETTREAAQMSQPHNRKVLTRRLPRLAAVVAGAVGLSHLILKVISAMSAPAPNDPTDPVLPQARQGFSQTGGSGTEPDANDSKQAN
jgi:hypothetical protein